MQLLVSFVCFKIVPCDRSNVKEFQTMFALVLGSISKELQVIFHVFNVGKFHKVGCNFYSQVLFQKNGVNRGGKRGHEKKGRAFSEIKSFKNNHMFVMPSIEGEEHAFVAKTFKAQKVEWWHQSFTKKGSCGTCIVKRGGME